MQLQPEYPVRTERLLLRPLRADDADALLVYRGRPDVCRYVPFEPMSRAVVLDRLGSTMASTGLTDEGQALFLAVVLRETGRLIGDVVLFFRSREHAGGEVGWVLDPAAGGRGYATEAAKALLELAFGDLGLHRVEARVDARNVASARLCERLGMRREAHFVRNEMFKGEWSDLLVYAILAEEWHHEEG